MPDVFQEMLDGLGNVQIRHAIIVHFPIVLSALGVPLALMSVIWSKRSALRWSVVAVYLLAAAGAWMAMNSGNEAEAASGAEITSAAAEHLETHEDMGSYAYLFAAGVVALFALSAAPARALRIGAGVAGFLLAVVAAMWVAATAHHGGELVYFYGVGTGQKLGSTGGSEGDGAADADAQGTDSTGDSDPRLAYFEEHVRPILEERCWGCHNPARAHRSGELDLTSFARILKGGESGDPAIVPGRLDQGVLLTAVSYEDPFLQMPPARKGGKLPDEAIAALRRWVEEGAVWVDRQNAPTGGWIDSGDEDDGDEEGGEGN